MGNYRERLASYRKALAVREENEDMILKLESQGSPRVMDAIERIEQTTEDMKTALRAAPGVIAQAEDAAGVNKFADIIFGNEDMYISHDLMNGVIESAVGVEGESLDLGMLPEDILGALVDNDGSCALGDTTAKFCKAFDFDPSIDGSPIENL